MTQPATLTIAEHAPPKLRSEGQRRFLALPGSLEEIREQCDARSKQAVCNWRSGAKTPSPPARRRIEEAFGIPSHSWSCRPGTDVALGGVRELPSAPRAAAAVVGPPPPASEPPPPPPASEPPPPPPAAPPPPPAPNIVTAEMRARQLAELRSGNALDECLELLATIRAERQVDGLLPGERVKLADAETKVMGLRAKLEQSGETSEARYVAQHPAWRRLKRAILEALKPHPVAARDVLAAIERVEAS
jgi:hypothetical protein